LDKVPIGGPLINALLDSARVNYSTPPGLSLGIIEQVGCDIHQLANYSINREWIQTMNSRRRALLSHLFFYNTSHTRHTRRIHLAPPFLLDEYTPRYMTLSPIDAAKKRAAAHAHLRNCNLCPRLCGVNRYETTGMCLVGEKVSVNVIVRHFGEGEISLSPPLLRSDSVVCRW